MKSSNLKKLPKDTRGLARCDWTYDDAPPVFYRRQDLTRNKKQKFSLQLITPRANRNLFGGRSFRSWRLSALIFILVLAVAALLFYWYPAFQISERLVTRSNIQFDSHKLLIPSLPSVKPKAVVYIAQRNDTVGQILTRFGANNEFSAKVQQAILDYERTDSKQTAVDKSDKKEKGKAQAAKLKLVYGQRFEFILKKKNDGFSLNFQTKDGVRLSVKTDKDGKIQIKHTELPKIERERIAVGYITSSFADAAAKSGVSYDIIDDMVDLFSNRVEFNKDLQPGDRFTLILSGREIEEGTGLADIVILAAALSVNGKQMNAVRFVGSDGKARYFDESGELIGDSFLRYPLKFSRISSYFSYARFHPILQRYRPHYGIDFAAPVGTPVRSVADGRITFAGYKGASGLMVEIQHTSRYKTNYLHLSKINSEVRTGARVTRSQVIGAVGNTGRSTGPHLHYGFYDNNKYTDPLKIKLPMMDDLVKGTRIDGGYLKKVAFTLQNYQAMKNTRPDWFQ